MITGQACNKQCDCEHSLVNPDGDRDCSHSLFDWENEDHLCEPLVEMLNATRPLLDEIERLRALIVRIDETLRVPAAEYVPAISDVFALIDDSTLRTALKKDREK